MKKIIIPCLFALLYIAMSKLLSFETGVFIALGSITATLCEIENKIKQKIMSRTNQNYNHFKDRLNLRFKLEISRPEYMSLCRTEDYVITKTDNEKITIQIYHKGVKLNCYKDHKEKGGRLLTVFTINTQLKINYFKFNK